MSKCCRESKANAAVSSPVEDQQAFQELKDLQAACAGSGGMGERAAFFD